MERDDQLQRKLEAEQQRRDDRQVHQEQVVRMVVDQQKKVEDKLDVLRDQTEKQQDSVDRILDGLKVLVNNYEEAEAMQQKVTAGRISRIQEEIAMNPGTLKGGNSGNIPAPVGKGLANVRKGPEKKQLLDDDDEFDPDFPCLWLDLSEDSKLGAIVTSRWFDMMCAVVIIVNSVFIGYQSQYAMDNAHRPSKEQKNDFIDGVEVFFLVFYTLELILRLLVWRLNFFYNEDWRWNWFDTALVVLAGYDLIVSRFEDEGSGGANLTWMRVLRLLKMLKMLRVVRVMRIFRELRLMLHSVIYSLRSLMWTLLMLSLLLYIFGLCFLQGVTAFLASEGTDLEPSIRDACLKYYGSVSEVMLTLYMTITGGLDWDLAAEPLKHAGDVYYYLFMLYIAFLTFVVVNVLTGIFVENALVTAHQDKHSVQKEELRADETIMKDLVSLFKDMAEESDGKVWWQDFQTVINKDRRAIDFLSSLQVDPAEAAELFKTLSDNGRMKVSCMDFVQGCLKIKGVAESQDLMSLMYVSHRYMTQLPILMGYMEDCFNEMHKVFERQGAAKSGLEPLSSRLNKVNEYSEYINKIKAEKKERSKRLFSAND